MQGLKKIVENSSFEFIIFLTYLTSKDIKPFNVECVTFAYIHALFLFFPFCLQPALFIFLSLWGCYPREYSAGASALMEVVPGVSVEREM